MLKRTQAAHIARKIAPPAFLALALLGLSPSTAHAVPAFARQTEQPCSACHVGAFGPQLTSFGRNFKLNGYTMGEVKHLWDGFSGMAFGSIENTAKDQPSAPAVGYGKNNAFAVDQASLFYGGKLASNIGILTQVTYTPSAKSFAWDNTDVRFADTTSLAGSSLVYGVTANNGPTVQDLWQTTPAWRFPYASSKLAPSVTTSPYLTALAQRVVGLGAYGLWNDLVYAELTGYTDLSSTTQSALGEVGPNQADHLNGVAPYWRVALQHDYGQHYVSVGTYGFDADRYPGNNHDTGTDNFLDYALDATYQFSSEDNLHRASLYGSILHEQQTLTATQAAGGSTNLDNSLTDFHANASYFYDNTYGVTVGRFSTKGSSDALLYSGSTTFKPDSSGWTAQIDWTPMGKEYSYLDSYMNMRLFLQYTLYNTYGGSGMNYDGTGRNASDNNTIYAGVWVAF